VEVVGVRTVSSGALSPPLREERDKGEEREGLNLGRRKEVTFE